MYQYNKNHKGASPPISFIDTNSCYKGTIWKTHEGYHVQVLEYCNKYNILIKFLETGNTQFVQITALRTGSIKNPLHRGKNGGYFGYGPFGKRSHIKAYQTWSNMLKRVNKEYQINNSRNMKYNNTTICDEWYNYQNFAQWYYEYLSLLNPEFTDQYQIDKDIIQWDNEYKIYSPKTCCLVPDKLNLALCNQNKERIIEQLPQGVHSNKYGTTFSINISLYGEAPYLGTFKTAEEAFLIYKKKKEEYIKELADFYYNKNAILKNIKDILYRIEIKP